MAAKTPTAARAADQGCITSPELIPTVAISGEVLPPPSREAIKRNAADLLRAMRDLIAGKISPTEGERIAAASRACSAARDGSPRRGRASSRLTQSSRAGVDIQPMIE